MLTPECEREEFVRLCVSAAREHERNARNLRALARRVQEPPEGTRVHVELWPRCVAQFITPGPEGGRDDS